jgi:hypothetical protein
MREGPQTLASGCIGQDWEKNTMSVPAERLLAYPCMEKKKEEIDVTV